MDQRVTIHSVNTGLIHAVLKLYFSKQYEHVSMPGLHNIEPAGRMRPAKVFLEARESLSIAQNVAKSRPRISNCDS